jgi:MSHA biogenesis protein MshP
MQPPRNAAPPRHRGPRAAKAAQARSRAGCRGFGALMAIVILVMLAAFGAFIVNIVTTQQYSSTLDLLGVRGYQAARSGADWAAFKIHDPENNNPGPIWTSPYSCSPTVTTSISGLAEDLADFTVTVVCDSSTYTEFGNTVRVYQVTATACNMPIAGACPNNVTGSPAYVERQVNSVFATCRLPSGASC